MWEDTLPHTLSKAQKQKVAAVLAGEQDFKKLRDSLGWHQLVLHWNWDDGVAPIAWWCSHAECDRGTALTAYWLAEPEFYARFSDREAARAAGCDTAVFDLVRDIERRMQAGFYASASIGFAPDASDGATVGTAAGEVPLAMREPVRGEPFPPIALETVFLRPVSESERDAIERKLRQGWKLIAPDARPGDAPLAVVEAIGCKVQAMRAEPRDLKALKGEVLGWLWLEMAHLAYGWPWLVWDWETGGSQGVFAPNRERGILDTTLVRHALTTSLIPEGGIRSLFVALPEIHGWSELDHYVGCGVIKPSSHLPYRG
jgi:hypothetical protein